MKYRILKDEELVELEEQLKQFLIVNGIDGAEWKRINEEEPDKALDLVELFSDYVLQIIYEQTRYLERRTEDTVFFFHYADDKASLIAIKAEQENPAIDLSTSEGILEALQKNAKQLAFFKSEKVYTKAREMEVHDMFQRGCLKSTQELWELLESITE